MPPRLAHVVLQTENIPRLRDWYNEVLGAHVVFEDEKIAFITYDHEHHRVAFLSAGMLREILGQDGQSAPAPSGIVTAGLNHFAYALNGMQELFDNYDRLKALGHLPYWCIDHGPSTAMYYHDPDGNSVEFQVDNFPTSEECTAYLRSPSFAQNPIGIEYDPEVKRKELRTGKRT